MHKVEGTGEVRKQKQCLCSTEGLSANVSQFSGARAMNTDVVYISNKFEGAWRDGLISKVFVTQE